MSKEKAFQQYLDSFEELAFLFVRDKEVHISSSDLKEFLKDSFEHGIEYQNSLKNSVVPEDFLI